MELTIKQADKVGDAALVGEIFWEYLSWAGPMLVEKFDVHLDVQSILEHDLLELDKYMPPSGRLMLAYVDGQLAGVASMRTIGDSIAEVKRMYVRPANRRQGVGRALVSRLIEEAAAAGYGRMRLDSARFMQDAHSLYRSMGFRDIDPYAGSEIPVEFQSHWVFMERELGR